MMPGDIYWVDFHDAAGRGQSGLRPAIVLQDDTAFPTQSPMVLTVPLTTRLNALRFPATMRIDPSPTNGLTAPSIALVFQLRSVDRAWVGAKLGQLDQTTLDDVLILFDRLAGR